MYYNTDTIIVNDNLERTKISYRYLDVFDLSLDTKTKPITDEQVLDRYDSFLINLIFGNDKPYRDRLSFKDYFDDDIQPIKRYDFLNVKGNKRWRKDLSVEKNFTIWLNFIVESTNEFFVKGTTQPTGSFDEYSFGDFVYGRELIRRTKYLNTIIFKYLDKLRYEIEQEIFPSLKPSVELDYHKIDETVMLWKNAFDIRYDYGDTITNYTKFIGWLLNVEYFSNKDKMIIYAYIKHALEVSYHDDLEDFGIELPSTKCSHKHLEKIIKDDNTIYMCAKCGKQFQSTMC